jgi:hypothetical protein
MMLQKHAWCCIFWYVHLPISAGSALRHTVIFSAKSSVRYRLLTCSCVVHNLLPCDHCAGVSLLTVCMSQHSTPRYLVNDSRVLSDPQ